MFQASGKPEVHYLRATLVKPLQPPGLEDLAVLGEGSDPLCDSTGFARHLAHKLCWGGSKATQTSKP